MYRTGSSDSQRSSLEIFILVMIGQGFTTKYDLQTAAGLSLGATVPALNRLSETKLVSQHVEGRRHEFAVTRAGEKALCDWRPSAVRTAMDYDDLLRTAFLSAFLLRDATGAAEILRQGARARSRAAEDRADELRGRSLDRAHLDAASYKWMRLFSELHRLGAESEALERIAIEIEPAKKTGVKRTRRRK